MPELNGGRILIKVGSQITKTIKTPGWWSGVATIGAAATHVEIINTNGGAVVSNVAVEVVNPTTEKLDIIVLAGQSNMVGASSGPDLDYSVDMPHPDVLALNGSTWSAASVVKGAVSHAHPRMQHQGLNQNGLGPGLALGRYYAENKLQPGRKVLLIAAAKGGTKLTGNSPWNFTGTDGALAEWALAAAQDAVALNPAHNRVVAVAWSQGESDYGAGSEALYPAAFGNLVAGFRSGLSDPSLPFVIIGLNPDAISANAQNMIAVQMGLTGNGVRYSGWQSATWGDGTKANPDNPDDTVHFGEWANRVRGAAAAIELIK